MDGVLDTAETTRLQARLLYLGWRRYRIPVDVGEDLVQAAILTFLEVKDRYPKEEEHPKILVGIFRNKCREYIDGEVRSARGLRALKAAAEGKDGSVSTAKADATAPGGVLGELVHREEGRLILQALAELRPKAREMFRLIIEEGADREDLIRHYHLNKNTLDSRLHTYRGELRKILARRGLRI